MGPMIRTGTKRLIVGAILIVPQLLAAQGTVSGQLSLQEKPGASSNDLASAVVYLVPAKPPKEKLKAMKATMTMHDR